MPALGKGGLQLHANNSLRCVYVAGAPRALAWPCAMRAGMGPSRRTSMMHGTCTTVAGTCTATTALHRPQMSGDVRVADRLLCESHTVQTLARAAYESAQHDIPVQANIPHLLHSTPGTGEGHAPRLHPFSSAIVQK